MLRFVNVYRCCFSSVKFKRKTSSSCLFQSTKPKFKACIRCNLKFSILRSKGMLARYHSSNAVVLFERGKGKSLFILPVERGKP